MKRLSERLKKFIPDTPQNRERILTPLERSVFRALKVMGERATKGREISRCLFEVRSIRGRTVLVMLLEGRHAMSVGHHVEKRFMEHNELEFVSLVESKRGAKVVLRPRIEEI
jgi:hypothetical protein